MIKLTQNDSKCASDAKMIVSKDKGSPRVHIARNPEKKYNVRHYKLDGELVTGQMCCDFLLLNDTLKNAYYIELKGSDIKHGVEQLEAGQKICRSLLDGYTAYYRLICSKASTHDIRSNTYRKFVDSVGSKYIVCKENRYEETL